MRQSIMGFNQAFAATLSVTKTDKNGKTITQKVDYTDLAILRWFVDFQCTGKMTSIEVSGERYFFVSYKKLLEDMPLLDISKQGVYLRLQKLVSLGLLKHHYHTEFGSQAFYCMGDNYLHLIQSDKVNTQIQTPSIINYTPPIYSSNDNGLITDRVISDNNNPYNPLAGENTSETSPKPDPLKEIRSELKSRINVLFHRRDNTTWTNREIARLQEIARRNGVLDEMGEIEKLYNSDYPYRRTSLGTFLNNWTTELDRARNYKPQQSKYDRTTREVADYDPGF